VCDKKAKGKAKAKACVDKQSAPSFSIYFNIVIEDIVWPSMKIFGLP